MFRYPEPYNHKDWYNFMKQISHYGWLGIDEQAVGAGDENRKYHLYTCPMCFSAVQASKIEQHRNWHDTYYIDDGR